MRTIRPFVMAGLVPAIHAGRVRDADGSFVAGVSSVDARNKCGHDEVVDQVNHP